MKVLWFMLVLCLMMIVHLPSTNGDEAYDAAVAVGSILKQAVGYLPVLPKFLSVADLFINIITKVRGIGAKKGDLWTQIEDRVDVKVGQGLSGYHLSDVKSEFRLFTTMIAKKSTFDRDDLNYIMAKQLRMIPQNYENLSFASQLATLLPAWTGYMVTGHLELISRNQLPKCSLANELQSLRDVTVNAAKSLFQKRYRDLKGTYFYRGRPDYRCAGVPCSFMARFVFTDSATSKKYDNIVGSVWTPMINTIQRNTLDILLKLLINPINAYFRSEICLKGCNCPAKIKSEEINFSYPKDCFGKAENNKQCTLPCYAYGSGYPWCPAYLGNRVRSNNLMTDSDWQRCKSADFLECMSVSSIAYSQK